MKRALKGLGTFWAAAIGSVFIPVAHFLLVPSFAADLLEVVAGRQVQVIDLEVTRRVARFEPAKFESKDQRPRRTPLHVTLAHQIAEAPGREHVAIARIVDAAAAAKHPGRPRPNVQLTPTAFGMYRCSACPGVLADSAAAQS